ncbi:hypothetical protein DPMN_182850 [Dreissena polymorpha]|uniref:Uncharacterized protein n=1 Tax=Dreissena polymorpha TaxID=45954 RepID=A0A9D4I4Z5_DREPO|nr:hypothetical protein DPMN_182850 [Dreissena polymorpha]
METPDDGLFDHDEADVTIVSYMFACAKSNQGVVRVLSDDTDIFILLVYWVYRANVQCRVQMKGLDMLKLNPKCMRLLGMHALSACDTTSYPYGKGKVDAFDKLLLGDYPGLSDVLGEKGKTNEELVKASKPFINALYDQPAENDSALQTLHKEEHSKTADTATNRTKPTSSHSTCTSTYHAVEGSKLQSTP